LPFFPTSCQVRFDDDSDAFVTLNVNKTDRSLMRFLQPRCDLDSSTVRLRVKGHQGHNEVTPTY